MGRVACGCGAGMAWVGDKGGVRARLDPSLLRALLGTRLVCGGRVVSHSDLDWIWDFGIRIRIRVVYSDD